jgi:CBS domain-containing membrane protein
MSLKEVSTPRAPESIDLNEDDILEAMKKIPGYLDITPHDFKEIYLMAYQMAVTRLSRQITAAEIMTRDVVLVREETPLAEVAAAMGARGISGVPVVAENGGVVGIISEKDILRRMGVAGRQNFMTVVAACLITKGCVSLPSQYQVAKDLMTSPALVIKPTTSVQEISILFAARGVNRVPVVDEAGKLVGIVSRGDLVQTILLGDKRC